MASMNNIAISVRLQVFVRTCMYSYLCISLGYVPWGTVSGRLGIACLMFGELLCLFPECQHHFPFPAAVHKGSDFFTSSPFVIVCPFDCGHSSGCEVIILLWVWYSFVYWLSKTSFMFFLAICISSFEEMPIQIRCPLLNCIVWLLSFKSAVCILNTSALSDAQLTNIFLLLYGLPFHFLDSVLWSTEVFNVYEVQFIFVPWPFGVICKKLSLNDAKVQWGFFEDFYDFSAYI